MKKICIILAFAIAQFLTVIPTAIGQEYIRGTVEKSFCDTSIIRERTSDSVFVYYSDSRNSLFMLVTPTSIYVPTVSLGSYYVNDFDIFGNRIYFCGYLLDNGQKKAMFGSFLLTSFPYCSFSCCILDTCTELRKLDVYRVGIDPDFDVHLAMTGTTGTRSDVIVDRVVSSNFPYMYPPCNVYFSNNETESFDDVAVTDKYIVVSSRKMEQGSPIVDFWQFSKPTTTGVSYLYMPVHHFRFYSPTVETPVFLEHVNADNYVAVYKEIGFSRIVMLQLSAPNTVSNCVEILGDTSQTVFPMEIKYEKNSMVYDILSCNDYDHNPRSQPPVMQIYHITPPVINNTALFGEGTRYPDYFLWSIDRAKWSGWFLASGALDRHPMVFRYKYDKWETCPEYFQYNYDVGKPIGLYYKVEEIDCYSFRLESKIIETEKDELRFATYCGERNN